MIRILVTILLGWIAMVTIAAPLGQLTSSSVAYFPGRQLLFLSPQAQVHLQPAAFKLQTPRIQPLVALGRIQTGKDQTIVYYPDGESPTDELMNWYNQVIQIIIQSWGQQIPIPIPGVGGGGEGGGDSGNNCDRLKEDCEATNSDSKAGNVEPFVQGQLTPASTVPLPLNRKFYTIGAVPQFFRNSNFLPNPQPFFTSQLLEPIRARSVAELQTLGTQKPAQQLLPPNTLPANVLIKPSGPFSGFEQTAENQNFGLQNRPEATAVQYQQYLSEQKVLHPENVAQKTEPNRIGAHGFVQLLGQTQPDPGYLSYNQGLKAVAESGEESNDRNEAIARPVAIAITGKGGLAASAPVGTAIVGEDGYALSAPTATAIAGDFALENVNAGTESKVEAIKLKKQ